ncbi:uncharacterized protein LOC101863722 [Aplysia californica]|uniref:Uncharacterized protein LOC101863722 n=1 Tax=Aplysia californica TaxID=6500 RepID=A0ABM0JEL5_APLCA|nr:uncharacterized protein LOC101863722 [Aplysia californica]
MSQRKKPVFGRRVRKRRGREVLPPPDPADLAKGQIVTDVRNSDDMIQAVRDRMCLWPTGDELICLLTMVQSEQSSESWRDTVQPPPAPPPEETPEEIPDKKFGRRK